MKEITIFILGLFALASCSRPSGSLKGSISYESSGEGTKLPDSGAKVSLYSLDMKDGKHNAGSAAADKAGKFIVEDIEPGSYFYIIESKNAKPCPAHAAYHLKLYRQEMKLLFGLDVSRYESRLMELDDLREKYDAILGSDASDYASISDKISAYETVQAEISKKAQALITDLPEGFKKNIGYAGKSRHEVTMGVVEVPEKQVSNLDFDFEMACR